MEEVARWQIDADGGESDEWPALTNDTCESALLTTGTVDCGGELKFNMETVELFVLRLDGECVWKNGVKKSTFFRE